MTEVLFPSVFAQANHQGQIPMLYPHATEKLRNVAIPIVKLSHITHKDEARKISSEVSGYEFQARKKFGKTRTLDGRPLGDSFRPSKSKHVFFQISDGKAVFPGYYSWWGVHPVERDGFTTPGEIQSELEELQQRTGFKAYVADYLKASPDSRYGNQAFICEFQDLLTSYAKTRGTTIDNVCIRKGGTLRYTFEICYVLIICTSKHEDDEDLADFEPLQPATSVPFEMDRFINDNGNILDPAATPIFHPGYTVTWSKHKSTPPGAKADMYSYETTAFGFYFPEDRSSLKLHKFAEITVRHYKEYCLKTKPPPGGGKWKCPNDL
jgi:hypothetical protein